MIIYISGGAGGKEAAETAASVSGTDIGCLLAFQSRIAKILRHTYRVMKGRKK